MQGKNEGTLQGLIEKRLSKVIDPGTGLDVLRMGLIKNLDVTNGAVSVVFGPSLRQCPLAFQLAFDVYDAVRAVPGVEHVLMRVANCHQAAELERPLGEKKQILASGQEPTPL